MKAMKAMKVKKLYVIRKESALKVFNKKKAMRKLAKGARKMRITESSIVDELIETGL